jgi:hypothetical protein
VQILLDSGADPNKIVNQTRFSEPGFDPHLISAQQSYPETVALVMDAQRNKTKKSRPETDH